MRAVLIPALLLVACAPRPPAAPANEQLTLTQERTYALECTHHDQERCGLVHDRLFQPKLSHRFVRKICHEDPLHPSAACKARQRKMFLAILADRYAEVTPEQLERHCDAQPRACEDLRELEQWMMKEHNEAVLARDENQTLAEQQEERRHNAVMTMLTQLTEK